MDDVTSMLQNFVKVYFSRFDLIQRDVTAVIFADLNLLQLLADFLNSAIQGYHKEGVAAVLYCVWILGRLPSLHFST
jgi:hypothetical protein